MEDVYFCVLSKGWEMVDVVGVDCFWLCVCLDYFKVCGFDVKCVLFDVLVIFCLEYGLVVL